VAGKNHLTNTGFLTSLPNPEKLIKLSISHNDFPTQDLSVFSRFINLESLILDSNNFFGSLEPLKGLAKLKHLNISYTNLDSGLEYLPESLERIDCDGTEACKNIRKQMKGCEKPFYPSPDTRAKVIYYSYQK